MLDIEVKGMARLEESLRKLALKLGQTQLVLERIAGEVLRAKLTRSMTSGMDPDGQALAKVERWTRTIRLGTAASIPRGRLVPLVATGQLRASMGTVRVTNKKLEFGFRGRMLKVANAMTKGTPGFMRVKKKRIRDAYSGIKTTEDASHDYARVQVAPGQWITKRIKGRNQVSIKPKKRDFFFLNDAMIDGAVKIVEDHIKKALAA